MRGGAAFVLALALSLLFTALAGGVRAEEPVSREFSDEEIRKMARTRAVVETSLGAMEIKFFPEKAPNHVYNFITLAREGFYNGTTFHRVIPGFMIQGGDPKSKDPNNRAAHGTGGPGYALKAEFNDLSHERGIVSMARSRHPDSAGSQFFICVADAPWLDGKYTVFGKVVSGMEVADRIVSQPRDRRDNPIERVEMKVRIAGPATEPFTRDEKGRPAEGDSPGEGKED